MTSAVVPSSEPGKDTSQSPLEQLRASWTELAATTGNVFSTWEWASIWWRHYGAGRQLLLSAVRGTDDRVVAIIPLYEWSARPLRIGRLLGHGPADQLGIVCDPFQQIPAAAEMARAADDADLDLLLAELLPGGPGWSDALGSRVLVRESSPILSLESGWDGFLRGRSANFRQQVRSRERRLAQRHALRFRLATDRERLDEDFTQFISLHAARWGRESAFMRFEQFHREFGAVAFERGWLRLWFLELDGRPVAAWLGFRFGQVESYYQAGRDPSLRDTSVGFVLLAHTIRDAAADGMREYRLLRGGEPFKRRFADRDPGLETHAVPTNVRGRAALALAYAGVRSAALRSLARRVGGQRGMA